MEVKSFTNSFIDFILPKFCLSCKAKILSDNKLLCSRCLNNISFATEDILEFQYKRSFAEDGYIEDFRSLYRFEKDSSLQDVLHNLKYNKKFAIGIYLGKRIATNFYDTFISWELDYLVPVPLHQIKKADRGYNQSFYISKGLSKIFHLPIKQHVLKRVRFTNTQTLLNIEERRLNVENAFQVKREKTFRGKNILIVDDVITTGSTVNECAKILKQNGANKIYAASAALA